MGAFRSSFSNYSGILSLRIEPRILLDLEDYVEDTSGVLEAYVGNIGRNEGDGENGLFGA